MGLVPIMTAYAFEITAGNEPTFGGLVADGELLLISALIAGGALGELVGRFPKYPLLNVVAGGGSVLTLFFSSLYYAHVATSSEATPEAVAQISLWVFVMTLLTGFGCIALAEDYDA